MPPLCAACDQVVVLGALRCRSCGADLAKVGTLVGITVGTEAICPPGSRADAALQLLDEVRRRSPALLDWLQADPVTRGPRPPTDIDVLEIYARARRLYFPDG